MLVLFARQESDILITGHMKHMHEKSSSACAGPPQSFWGAVWSFERYIDIAEAPISFHKYPHINDSNAGHNLRKQKQKPEYE